MIGYQPLTRDVAQRVADALCGQMNWALEKIELRGPDWWLHGTKKSDGSFVLYCLGGFCGE